MDLEGRFLAKEMAGSTMVNRLAQASLAME